MDLARVLLLPASQAGHAATAHEPRHIERLWRGNVPLSAKRLLLAQWLQAGILVHDAHASITVVKRARPGHDAALGFFAALALQADEAALDAPDADHAMLVDGGLAVVPTMVHYHDDTGRLKRALLSAIDREPDAAFLDGDVEVECFAVDDDTLSARLSTLGPTPDVLDGHAHARAAALWCRRHAGDGGDGACGYGLAFMVDAADAFASPPIGVAMMRMLDANPALPSRGGV